MSSSSDSSSSLPGSEEEESFLREIVELSGIVPYDQDLEALATPGEAAEHEARMTEEAKIVSQDSLRRLNLLHGTIFKLALLYSL